MSPIISERRVTRRAMLEGLAVAGVRAATPARRWSQASAAVAGDWTSSLLAFLRSYARPDDGYAWPDHPDSHQTTTFAAIGYHVLLKREPPSKAASTEFVRAHEVEWRRWTIPPARAHWFP